MSRTPRSRHASVRVRVLACALAALLALACALAASAAPRTAVARDTVRVVSDSARAAVRAPDTGPFFYVGRAYGSESLVHPLRLIVNGGFGILQFDNRDNRLAEVDFVGGWNRVKSDLLHPGRAIGVEGWADFAQRELLPFSVNRKAAQYWPNYTLHLVGGGMSYRMMREWYAYQGFERPRAWSLGTMVVYHALNEVVENDARPGPTTDAVADVYVFDPLGILLFDRDDVSRFFGRRLHLRDWSNQPAVDPWHGTIDDQGQNYAIKVPLPGTARWSALYYFGNHGEAGLTYTRPGGDAFSLAAGLRAGKLVELGDGVQTAELVPTYGFFYDRDGSLMLSVTSATSSRYRLRVNVYPGLVRVRGVTLGAFLMLDRDGGAVAGVHLPWAPVGLAARP
jgi:hypothetical protein